MLRPISTILGLCTLGALAFHGTALASTLGSDNAANSTYANGGWVDGSNGGTGFGAWELDPSILVADTIHPAAATAPATAGNFIGTSTQLSTDATGNNNGANIDSAGVSFGIYGQNATDGSGNQATFNAYRLFDGGALAVGQSFSISIAVNFRNGNKGIDVFNGDDNLFNINVGGDTYAVNNTTTLSAQLNNTYDVNTAFALTLTQTTANGGTFTVNRSGGVTDSVSGTYTGDPNEFHLYADNTDQGAQNNLFANNMAITAAPEPGTWTLLALGGVGALALVRRRAGAV